MTTDVVCLSVDVEWASAPVLADLVRHLDERGLKATFFCTHVGIEVPGHERGLHPNFRRQGDILRGLRERHGADFDSWPEERLYREVVAATLAFAPEARGVRNHSLFYDSQLVPICSQAGLQYDSTYALPLVEGLRPIWKEYDLLELPIYYNDHFDLKARATEFQVDHLGLDRPGLKVFNFHPNMVFLNAETNERYLESKPYYHDPERLLTLRNPGRGVRSLFLDLLDDLAGRAGSTATLGEVNERVRRARSRP